MQDLEQQLLLYQLLVEKSLGLMCIHDLDGVLLAINPAVARSLGYRVEEGLGRNLREFLVPAVQPLFDAYLYRIRTHPTDSGLLRLLAKDGTERIWSYRNIRYEERGEPPKVLGHALDVTEQALAESALKESRNALAKAHDELALRVEERTAELQQANQRLRAEIEQRKLIEEELLRARKLESLGILAGGIAHDFNNFLTIVQGNVALAKTHARPGDPVYEMLEQTAAACGRAALLAAQLLTFAKGGAPILRIGDVSELLRDAVDLGRAGSRVTIHLAIAPDLWPAQFDAGQMAQVFHNVLLNARQAMSEGGVIEVRAENAIPGAGLLLNPGNYIRISVRDQGSGIPADILPSIFDPYFTTKETGSGLGLATAYAIVAKHKGHISVHSSVGEGTTVSIYLPASEERPQEEKAAPAVIHEGSGRILVMDDEEMIRRVLAKTLQRLGYEVECAGDGKEALALFKSAKTAGRGFAAVVVDLTVPGGMGGREAALELRAIDPGVRVILSSGYSDDSTISDFRKHGFDDILLKPWTPAQLSAALKRVLRDDVR
jgi:PAS domain S-box-containing protein